MHLIHPLRGFWSILGSFVDVKFESGHWASIPSLCRYFRQEWNYVRIYDVQESRNYYLYRHCYVFEYKGHDSYWYLSYVVGNDISIEGRDEGGKFMIGLAFLSLCFSIMFFTFFLKSKKGESGRIACLIAFVSLAAYALYEGVYISQWLKTIKGAPIRIDLMLYLPILMVISLVAIIRIRRRSKK